MPVAKDTMIEVIDVNKEYRRAGAIIRALVDINLTIKSGDFVIIQGPTGCGKSTLLNVMSGLDLPDSGKIIFDGENIARATEDRLSKLRRQKVGFVFQDFNLIKTLTAIENIEALLWPTVLSSKEIENRAIAALRDVEMLERKDHFPGSLDEMPTTGVPVHSPASPLDRANPRRVLEAVVHLEQYEPNQPVPMQTTDLNRLLSDLIM